MGPLFALTTDFGSGSTYVAQLKGVLYDAHPDARIVDVTHDLPAHDVRAAELHLRGTAFALPLGAVHVVVVDPGVGTARRGIAVRARNVTFVGPDNGVLGIALSQPDARVVHLDRPAFMRHPIAPTFHGRDVFAPVAAELAAGIALEEVGTPIDDALPSTLPAPARTDAGWAGEVLGADHFGNLATNLPAAAIARALGAYRVVVDGVPIPSYTTYGEAGAGELFALVGSDGYVELAVPQGRAADRVAVGTAVVCAPA